MGGPLIVFEGIDGSGLSTHAAIFSTYIRETLCRPCHLTKEPTDGPVGAQLRQHLRGRLSLDTGTLALMFAADRLDHLAFDILPHLERDFIVIVDRYYLSSLAYQSLDLDLSWLRAINARCRQPDLTIFLDVPVDTSMARLKAERFALEVFENADTLAQVREHYLQLIDVLRGEGERIAVIPQFVEGQERTIRDVAADVRDECLRVIGQ